MLGNRSSIIEKDVYPKACTPSKGRGKLLMALGIRKASGRKCHMRWAFKDLRVFLRLYEVEATPHRRNCTLSHTSD